MNDFPELNPFEQSLSAFALPAAKLDRDVLFYEAGRMAAVRAQSVPKSWLASYGWPSSFAAMTTVAALLLAIVLAQHGKMAATTVIASRPITPISPNDFQLPSPESPSSTGGLAATLNEAKEWDQIWHDGVDARVPAAIASVDAPKHKGASLFGHESLNEFLRDQ